MNHEDFHFNEESNSNNHDRWLVSFADFITLLFAFFVVLYATSHQDVEKTKQFQESIKKFLIKAGTNFGGASQENISSHERFDTILESPVKNVRLTTTAQQDQTIFDEAEKYLEDHLSEKERDQYILDLEQDPLGVRIILSSHHLFATQSAKFKADALSFLSKLGQLFNHFQRRLLIEGHLTHEFHSPFYPSAWELAGAQVTSLVRYWIKSQKMPAHLFLPISYGTSRPTTGLQKQDDRIEIVLLTDDVAF